MLPASTELVRPPRQAVDPEVHDRPLVAAARAAAGALMDLVGPAFWAAIVVLFAAKTFTG